MKGIKLSLREKIINGLFMFGFIAIMTMIAFCGWNTGEEMAVKKAETAIPAEEASWTVSRDNYGDEWFNFQVME